MKPATMFFSVIVFILSFSAVAATSFAQSPDSDVDSETPVVATPSDGTDPTVPDVTPVPEPAGPPGPPGDPSDSDDSDTDGDTEPDSSGSSESGQPFGQSSGGDCRNIVTHLATPVRVLKCGDWFAFYWVGKGSVMSGPAFPHPASSVRLSSGILYDGVSPATSQPVRILYDASSKRYRVETFYANTEYDTNKPYVFEIDASNSVSHILW